LDLLRELGDTWAIAATLSTMARSAAAQADTQRALRLCADALRGHRDCGDWLWTARTLQTCAFVVCMEGNWRWSARLLGAALELRETMRAPLTAADRTELDRAMASLGQAQPDRRRLQGAVRLGRDALAERSVTDALRLCDQVVSKRRSSDRRGAELTRREHEVATLVATGLSNREIGEQLLISLRTADTHVKRILSKLGVGSRAQIAAWSVQQGRPGLTPSSRP
jgi:non-specific serine/threonine protein kinase